MKYKNLGIVLGVVALVAILSVGVVKAQAGGGFIGFLYSIYTADQNQNIGTNFTMNTSNSKYTESADLYQNVQAMAERMAGLSQYQVLQANSAGQMEAVAISALAGDVGGKLVRAGDVTALTTTTALTAAQVCDSSILQVTTALGTSTITFPATTTLYADCLDTNGDSKTLTFYNASAVTSTIIAAGSGGTAFYSSTLTISASDTATVEVVRQTANAYLLLVTNQPS
jgi:hypothetical protein